MVKECAETSATSSPRPHALGIGGVETGKDAAQFILLGADTVQVCTGVMKLGYDMVKRMKDELLSFMAQAQVRDHRRLQGPQPPVLHHPRRPREAPGRSQGQPQGQGQGHGHQGQRVGRATNFVKQSDALARN
jgi:dihydropyrimidine dehydrogenase (NADP+)/dihydropyrimidine dehydrogenase (NAD+) subunit PreA